MNPACWGVRPAIICETGRAAALAYNPRTPLIAEYSHRFRLMERSAIWMFAALFIALAARAQFASFSMPAMEMIVMVLAGALCADLIAGLVHWAADTWGDQTWPIVGPTLIRSFREHHVDPKAITRHDFIEANGATALILLPFILGVHVALPAGASGWRHVHYQWTVFALSLTFLVFMTNQIHKWSHVDRPPHVVRLLQNLRLILPVEHHQVHHRGHHMSRYCITTGWFNHVLDRIRFFRASEQMIQAVSTLRPREDDLKLIGLD
jgi:plasmanylethanolamine desaturase